MTFQEKREFLKQLKEHLLKEALNQSMSEDFTNGFNYVLWEMKIYGCFKDEEWK